MKKWYSVLVYVFVLVISDPYKGIDYNKVNTYETNYCSDYCNSSKDEYSDYFEEESEEIEELEDEYRDNEEEEEARYPLIFSIDNYFSKK